MGYTLNFDAVWRNFDDLLWGLGLSLVLAFVAIGIGCASASSSPSGGSAGRGSCPFRRVPTSRCSATCRFS